MVVVALSAGRRNLQQLRSILRCGAETRGTDRSSGCRVHAPAIKSAFELLIRRQIRNVHYGVGPVRAIHAISPGAWHLAGYHSAVVVPVEAKPRSLLPGLVLQMSRGVENFIMVDAENFAAGRYWARWGGADSTDLRFKEARRDVREHYIRRKSVEVRHGAANRKAGDFGAGPLDGKSDR